MPIEILKSFIGDNYPNLLLTLPAFLFIAGQIISVISNGQTRKKFEEFDHISIILNTFYTNYFLNFFVLAIAYQIIYNLSDKKEESVIMYPILFSAIIVILYSNNKDEKIQSCKEFEIGSIEMIILGAISIIIFYFLHIDPIIIFPHSFMIYIFIIFNILFFVWILVLYYKSPEKKFKLIFFLGIYDVICVIEFLIVASIITYILFNEINLGIYSGIFISLIIFLYSVISSSNRTRSINSLNEN